MNLKGKKLTRKPKLNALAEVDNLPAAQTASGSPAIQVPTVPKEISKLGKKKFKDWMKRTFGTEDTVLQNRFLDQSIMAVGDFVGHEMESFDHVAAALRGIKPKDALEGMLAVQMVAVHTLAMECMGPRAITLISSLGKPIFFAMAIAYVVTRFECGSISASLRAGDVIFAVSYYD